MTTETLGRPRRIALPIRGMTCAACAGRVESALKKAPGVAGVTVNLMAERADLELAPAADLPALLEAIDAAGYSVPHRRLELEIAGMTCASCVARVERALRGVPGVVAADADLARERARVDLVDGETRLADLILALDRAGYAATPIAADAAEQAMRAAAEARAARRDTVEVAAGLLLVLPLVLPMLVGAHPDGWLQLILATPVELWIGRRFFVGAFKALRAGAANMDVLVALGTGAAYLHGVITVLLQGPHAPVYFESAAVVVALVRLGKWLEARAKRRAGEALAALARLRPDTALVLRDSTAVEVPAGAVEPGDIVLVKPGARLPVDGTVAEGESEVDESILTGESDPVPKRAGDPVTGGALNGNGLLKIRTTAVGAETRLARIAALVDGAQAAKPPIQRLVDRVAAWFVPVVLGIAALTFAAWGLASGDLQAGFLPALAVLVISCPCALGLATPAAMLAGTGAAARAGILIRDFEAIERAGRIDAVLFDKTGTLTMGRPKVVAVETLRGDRDALLRLAALAEAGSEHPIARALREAACERALAPPVHFEARPGGGLVATVDGRSVAIGNLRLMAALGIDPAPAADAADRVAAGGTTVLYVATDGMLLGLIGVADAPRPESAAAIAALTGRGLAVAMVTGDSPAAAAPVAQALGITDVTAGVEPWDKVRAVEKLQETGKRVVMVGDGVNDAPALARADLGMAIGGAADVAIGAAGITLMRDDPRLVPAALDIAGAIGGKIRWNLFWAFAYNAAGIPLAALGLLSPMIAGAAMAASSLCVVLNAMRLQFWKAT